MLCLLIFLSSFFSSKYMYYFLISLRVTCGMIFQPVFPMISPSPLSYLVPHFDVVLNSSTSILIHTEISYLLTAVLCYDHSTSYMHLGIKSSRLRYAYVICALQFM